MFRQKAWCPIHYISCDAAVPAYLSDIFQYSKFICVKLQMTEPLNLYVSRYKRQYGLSILL